MAIGDAIRKYNAQKEAEAAEAAKQGAPPVTLSREEYERLTAPPPQAVDTPEPTMAAILAKMTDLVAQVLAAKTDPERETAAKQVEMIERLITKTHPENVEHPGISVYSHPEGDRFHPKDDLRCKMFWIGYELKTDTLRPDEIALLNRVQPGEFRVTKADGTGIPFRVTAKQSDKLGEDGRPQIEQLSMWFPCKGDQRDNHLSMTSYLQQVLGDKLPTIQEALAELAKLKAELAAARVGVPA
jgi:hypothetical protein